MELLFQVLAAIGGGGVVIIGLSKFIGDIWGNRIRERQRARTERELESWRHRFGLRRVQADRFAGSQYDAFLGLWRTLQELRLAVDALWQTASPANVSILSRQLKRTKTQVEQWSLFFDEGQYMELLRLIGHLEAFRVGKIRLVEVRSKNDLRLVFPAEVERQVEENWAAKAAFDHLMEGLRSSFRDRLSSIDVA